MQESQTIYSAEIKKIEQVKRVVQSLVQMLEEAAQIIDFFDKWDEQKRVKRDIKHNYYC